MEPPSTARTPLRALPVVLVAAATFAAFAPSLGSGFVNWDDPHNFLNNPHYRGLGPEQIKWMFTTVDSLYIPLTWLTLGLDFAIWGMNPFGYHLTNILIHALNAALFFLLIDRLLLQASPESDRQPRTWAAAAGALFFSIHPLRVESVAWITERRDVLSGCFFLLCLLAYVKRAEEAPGTSARRLASALSFGAFGCSLLSKPTGMTLPLALLVLDAYPLRRNSRESWRALLLEKVPYLALMIGAAVLTAVGLRGSNAFLASADYPLVQRLAQPGYRVSFYVLKTLVPVSLSPMYLYRPALGLFHLLGGLAVACVTAIVILRRAALPSACAAWLAFGFLIAPVSGLSQAGHHFAADRYTYLPFLPVAVLLAGGLLTAARRVPQAVLVSLGATALVGLSALTVLQTRVWHDSLALWDQAVRVDPDCWEAYLNRGQARHETGNLAGALEDYSRCLELKPDYVTALTNRGSVKADLQDFGGAVADYDRAIQLQSTYERAWNLRGLAREKFGDREGALRDYDRALELQPEYPNALANRGFLRRNGGDLDGALRDAEAALRIAPNNGTAYVLRASVRNARGDRAAALADLDRAVERSPTSVEAFNNRAMILMQTGRAREALADFERAAALTPGNPAVLMGRGQARYVLGDLSGAAADLQLALKHAPPGWRYRGDAEALLKKALQPR